MLSRIISEHATVARRRRITLALLTLLVVSAPIPAAMAVPGSAPLPLVDGVPPEGPELVIAIHPDDPSPTSGATVDWTVTLSNRSGFDARETSPVERNKPSS